MTFRQINTKYLVPAAQWIMILGIIGLCQPWNLFFHRFGLTITLFGLVMFLIVMHIPPAEEEDEAEQEDAI